MKTCQGWTLVELLIVLAILSITLGFASGSYGIIQKARYQSAGNDIAQAVMYARTLSLGSSAPSYLCPSQDGISCQKAWSGQLIVYRDLNGDKLLDVDDETLRVINFKDRQAKIKWRAFQNKRYLEITASGMTNYQNGTFTLCPINGDLHHAKTIILNVAGRPYFGKDKNGNGIMEYSSGKDVSCD